MFGFRSEEFREGRDVVRIEVKYRYVPHLNILQDQHLNLPPYLNKVHIVQ